MEREQHLAEERERAALQAAIDAEFYRRGINPNVVPFYGATSHNNRTAPYPEPGRFTPQNFGYHPVFGQHVVFGGRFMPLPGMPTPPAPPLPYPQLAQWHMMQRALYDAEQARARRENRAYGAPYGENAFFGGRHAPFSSVQTTGPPRHSGIFQNRMMGEDLYSQAEAVAQVLIRADTARRHGGVAGSTIDQFAYGGYHPPAIDDEDTNNPPPTSSIYDYPQLQAALRDDQRHHDIEHFWQEERTRQVTFEPDTPDMMQQPGNTYDAGSSQLTHATEFADPGHEEAVAPVQPLSPSGFSTPWSHRGEEMHPQRKLCAYHAQQEMGNDLNKRIHKASKFMTNLGHTPEYIDMVINEPGDTAAEHVAAPKETNRQMCVKFRSTARGRKNTTTRQIEKSTRGKEVRSIGQQAASKDIDQAARGKKAPPSAKETHTKETAKADVGKKSTTGAKEKCTKEIAPTLGSKVTPPAAEKKEEATGDKVPIPAAPKNTEQDAQGEEPNSAGEKTNTEAQLTPQKKQKAKSGKKCE